MNETTLVDIFTLLEWLCADLPFPIAWFRHGDDGLTPTYKSAIVDTDGMYGVVNVPSITRVIRPTLFVDGVPDPPTVNLTIGTVVNHAEVTISVYSMSGLTHPVEVLHHLDNRLELLSMTQPDIPDLGGFCHRVELLRTGNIVSTRVEHQQVFEPVAVSSYTCYLLPQKLPSVTIDNVAGISVLAVDHQRGASADEPGVIPDNTILVVQP